jgi:hypothetical protein
MIGFLKNLARALAAFFEIKLLRARHELSRQIEKDLAEDEMEFQRLRALPDSGSQRAADRVLARIARSEGVIADISGANHHPPGESTRPDGGGDLHAANGGNLAQ